MIFTEQDMFDSCRDVLLFRSIFSVLSRGEKIVTILFFPIGYVLAMIGLILFWIALRRDKM
ncbi:hypothetical protein AV545_03870 [Paenibacillus jamilae]|nr:hypothetical protein AV545_03870 [Paenibacillus jamilae]